MAARWTEAIGMVKAVRPRVAGVAKNPHPVDRHAGGRVRMRRMIVGMSQEKLGEALGVTFQQVQKYEKGTNRISASRLQQMAAVLGVPVEFFFEGAPRASSQDVGAGDVAPSNVANFLSTSEGVQLTRAFVRITDPKIRRRLISLVKVIAGDEND
jgi:transcriptional regulator with XRE-family HTH domain